MITRILKYLWALYAAIAFIATVLFALPVYAVFFLLYPSEKADKKAYSISRGWGKALMVLFLIRLRKEFDQIPDKNKPYIFIANHRSMLDIPVVAALIPNHFRFLAKKSLTRIPVLGWIVKGICISVDRNKIKDKRNSYELMKKTLDQGSSVLIFPEGTRSPSSVKLNDFHNGAFKLSKETNVPIIVISLWETTRILSKQAFFEMKPGTIYCHISKPVNALKPLNEFKMNIKMSMEEKIDSYQILTKSK